MTQSYPLLKVCLCATLYTCIKPQHIETGRQQESEQREACQSTRSHNWTSIEPLKARACRTKSRHAVKRQKPKQLQRRPQNTQRGSSSRVMYTGCCEHWKPLRACDAGWRACAAAEGARRVRWWARLSSVLASQIRHITALRCVHTLPLAPRAHAAR